MNYIFKLAYANLVKEKRRTLLTFLIISFGLLYYIWNICILKGFLDASMENLINFETGDLKIRSKNYDEERPFKIKNFIKNPKEVIEILKKKSFIKAFTERIVFLGEIDNSIDSVSCIICGINLKRDPNVFNLEQFTKKGKMNLSKNSAIIGKNLAKDMGLKNGDSFYITFRNGQGMIDSIELDLVDTIDAPNPQVNSSYVFIDVTKAEKFINTQNVSEISIKTEDNKKVDIYKKELIKELKDCSVSTWKQLGESTFKIDKMKKQGLFFLIFFIAVIAAVGIVNTMIMSVMEKKSEIGMLKAMGMTDFDIKRLFVTEGLIMGIIGGLLGVIGGIAVTYYFVEYGLDINKIMDNKNVNIGYKVMGIVKAKWDYSAIIKGFFASIVLCVAAAYFPAKKATELNPVDCLRNIR